MANNLRDRAQFREIDGVKYEVWPLGHSLAQRILTKFLRSMAAMAGAVDAPDSAQLGALARALSDEDIDFIAKNFGDASAYESEDGKSVPLVKVVQDMHFAGRFDVFLRWLLFCAEVNFSGFFDTARRQAIADDFNRLTGAPEASKTE